MKKLVYFLVSVSEAESFHVGAEFNYARSGIFPTKEAVLTVVNPGVRKKFSIIVELSVPNQEFIKPQGNSGKIALLKKSLSTIERRISWKDLQMELESVTKEQASMQTV